MIYRVENLGPLREAEVDLSKRLLVLTGPNNSGKTYLAWSLYGLRRLRSAGSGQVFEDFVEQLLASPTQEITVEALTQQLPAILSAIAGSYAQQSYQCFAAEPEAFSGTMASLRIGKNEPSPQSPFEHVRFQFASTIRLMGFDTTTTLDLNATGVTLHLQQRIPGLRSPITDIPARPHWQWLNSDELDAEQLKSLRTFLVRQLAQFLHLVLFPVTCTLFPAERIAVNIFAKELALKRTALVDDLLDADIDGRDGMPVDVRRRAGRYPWPIRDSLQVANDLENLSKDVGELNDLAEELERDLLQGRVGLSAHGEFTFSPATAPERQLSIHLTASVVKSLADLVFYFRHRARKGDFIIIDEPELNLHPDNQRRLARILAKAVNRGFQIMVSTHSDYIIGELNNMIMLSKVAEDDARKLGFDPTAALSPEKVGVYLFDKGTATPVEVEETGFSVKSIDDATRALNADTQRLYGQLFDER
jgi:energy-coupling factor transporter ATP-binding protein EcfA2